VLYRGAAELRTDFRQQGVAVIALNALQFDLDEFVSMQRTVDFLHHCRGKAIAGDGDDGLDMVGSGPQVAALDGRQFNHGIILTR